MRKLGKSFRLQADSIGEVTDPFDMAAKRLVRDHDLRFGPRRFKLRQGPLLNALALWFVELSMEEQNRIALAAVKRLEQFLISQDRVEHLAGRPERKADIAKKPGKRRNKGVG